MVALPEDPPRLTPLQIGSCPATSSGWPPPSPIFPQSGPCLTIPGGQLQSAQAHSSVCATVEVGPRRQLHWRPILHTSIPAAAAVKTTHQLHRGGGGTAPHSSVPTTVVARPHSQLGQGPALPVSASTAVAATMGGHTSPHREHLCSTWLW